MSELLSTIARQMMSGSAVEMNGKRLPGPVADGIL